jgi:hypothetical protein
LDHTGAECDARHTRRYPDKDGEEQTLIALTKSPSRKYQITIKQKNARVPSGTSRSNGLT